MRRAIDRLTQIAPSASAPSPSTIPRQPAQLQRPYAATASTETSLRTITTSSQLLQHGQVEDVGHLNVLQPDVGGVEGKPHREGKLRVHEEPSLRVTVRVTHGRVKI